MVDMYPVGASALGMRAKPVPPPKPGPRPPSLKPPLPPHKPTLANQRFRGGGGVVVSVKRKPLTCVDDMAQNPLYMYR